MLDNAKAYQLLRTTYTMAVISPVCLLGPFVLTHTGKTRIFLYNMVDVSMSISELCFNALTTVSRR